MVATAADAAVERKREGLYLVCGKGVWGKGNYNGQTVWRYKRLIVSKRGWHQRGKTEVSKGCHLKYFEQILGLGQTKEQEEEEHEGR